ncbi:MAG: His/Gly/Thr/Pro-type tRNA ligase C-terminal domain-containing protein, partial [Candidatus Omnitrophica bacterium]|nr:His/Gly/Thr/Pro-type tRNA ligase C-terminal domain-containing protein [Candidatus Omnitrophota bacterium]
GFNAVSIELSTRPQKSIGSDQDWEKATQALEEALKEKGLAYVINEGDGAFYGPKIDIKIKDALKRKWQCATIQCDFALPKRFSLTYIDNAGKEQQPIMLHRVLLGSLERFVGTLIEHYNGDLPLWLAPVQVLVIPIKDTVMEYTQKIEQALKTQGIRVEVDSHNETLDKKIRNAEINKVPYSLVVGEREEKSGLVSIRQKGKGNIGTLALDEFIKKIKEEIEKKAA